MIEASARNAVPKSPSTAVQEKNFVMHRVRTLMDELRMARRLEISFPMHNSSSVDLTRIPKRGGACRHL